MTNVRVEPGGVMSSVVASGREETPRWYDSLLFLALMSGPPKFRNRDPFASLAGEIDLPVLIQIGVWACGALWVAGRLYPTVLRHGRVPRLSATQVLGAMFIVSLTLSIADSPGILLTTFTVGQFAVMLSFLYVFTHRFGAYTCLRHMFIGVTVLALATVAAIFLAPELVTEATFQLGETRLRGDNIADTGSVAVIGLIFCLSSIPALRGSAFWGTLSLFGLLLAASRTRSAYAAFLVFLAVGFIHGKRLRVRTLIIPLAVLTLGIVLLDAFSSTADYLIRERESLGTMSDRIPLWQHLTSVVMAEAPLTGLGYHAASRVVATDYNPGLGNAHSVLFEVLVGGGILGATAYLLFCASLVWFAVRLLRVASGQPTAVAAVGLLSVSLLMGVATPAGMHAGPLGFAFWSTSALLPELLRQYSRGFASRQPLQPRRSLVRVAAGTRVGLRDCQAE